MTRLAVVVALAICGAPGTLASGNPAQHAADDSPPSNGYVLGPDDVIAIKALDAEEINNPSLRIDPGGFISLPMLGRVEARGLTVERLEKVLSTRLKTYVRDPVVAVSVVEFRSQPVSVIGYVGQPGVHQLEGRKTLIEILAKAGGLRPEAGNTIRITRKAEWGPIPLSSAKADETGRFSVAEVKLKELLQATNPADNILIRPDDIITVPRADLVYVLGEVKKPGGFILYERATIMGLQALAMADGFTTSAQPRRAVIIRRTADGKRIEIPANLKDILSGKAHDVEVFPEDILFVPTNAAKSALVRTMETALSAATGAAIYRIY